MKALEPCTVIGATLDDLPELMSLLRVMHSEGGMFDLDEDCARAFYLRTLRDKEGIIGVIRGEGSEIRAAIHLLIARFWYTSKYHVEEVYNFVRPEFRRSNYADAMLRFAKNAQAELNIPAMIGILTNSRMEAKVRLYRRRLGMPSGAFFLIGAHWVNETAADDSLWRVHQRTRKKRVVGEEALPLTNGAASG